MLRPQSSSVLRQQDDGQNRRSNLKPVKYGATRRSYRFLLGVTEGSVFFGDGKAVLERCTLAAPASEKQKPVRASYTPPVATVRQGVPPSTPAKPMAGLYVGGVLCASLVATWIYAFIARMKSDMEGNNSLPNPNLRGQLLTEDVPLYSPPSSRSSNGPPFDPNTPPLDSMPNTPAIVLLSAQSPHQLHSLLDVDREYLTAGEYLAVQSLVAGAALLEQGKESAMKAMRGELEQSAENAVVEVQVVGLAAQAVRQQRAVAAVMDGLQLVERGLVQQQMVLKDAGRDCVEADNASMQVALRGLHSQVYDATLLRSLLLRSRVAMDMLLEALQDAANKVQSAEKDRDVALEAAANSTADAEMAQLREEVATLKAKLEDQEATYWQSQAQLQAVSEQASRAMQRARIAETETASRYELELNQAVADRDNLQAMLERMDSMIEGFYKVSEYLLEEVYFYIPSDLWQAGQSVVEATDSAAWREGCVRLARVLRQTALSMDDATVAQLGELRAAVLDSDVRLLALESSSSEEVREARESQLLEKSDDARRQYVRILKAHMGVDLRREEEEVMQRLRGLALDAPPEVSEGKANVAPPEIRPPQDEEDLSQLGAVELQWRLVAAEERLGTLQKQEEELQKLRDEQDNSPIPVNPSQLQAELSSIQTQMVTTNRQLSLIQQALADATPETLPATPSTSDTVPEPGMENSKASDGNAPTRDASPPKEADRDEPWVSAVNDLVNRFGGNFGLQRPGGRARGGSVALEEAPPVDAATNGAATVAAPSIQLVMSGVEIPHIRKRAKGGEDAQFTASQSGMAAMGVADGVGGWAAENVDPRLYPTELMNQAKEAVGGSAPPATALEMLEYAHERTHEPGTCTACVALHTTGSPLISLANLGDSGARLYRDGQCIMRTESQLHGYNQPFQLGDLEFHEADTPEAADVYEWEVAPGDILVLGTDGLWDNLWDSELTEVMQSTRSSIEPQGSSAEGNRQLLADLLASSIARAAFNHAQDPRKATPWAAAQDAEQGRQGTLGGKMDDTTVVVGIFS